MRMNGTGIAATLLAGAVLAGCQMGGGTQRTFVDTPAPVQNGVEGAWVDQAGTGVTNFNAGRFETFATDSGQKLSEGGYVMRSPQLIEISGTSIIRQSPIAFNCAVAGTTQLNCTSSSGQQFILTRRAMASR